MRMSSSHKNKSILILILIPWGITQWWIPWVFLLPPMRPGQNSVKDSSPESPTGKKKKLTNKAYEWTLFPKRAYLNRKQFWKYPPYYRQIPTELLTCLVSVRLSKELICCQTSSYQNSWQHSDFPGQSWNKQLIFHSPPIGRKKKTTHMWKC